MKRITILGIMEHAWFKVDDTAVSQIDSVALSEVCQKLSVPAHEVIGALRSGECVGVGVGGCGRGCGCGWEGC